MNQYVYKCKDNRMRMVIVDDDGKHTSVSYPRFLMEQFLGRSLAENEDVHHKDGNPLNNDLNNLELIEHGIHQKEHSQKYMDTEEKCMICGKPFIMTAHKWSKFFVDIRRDRARILTCSRSCASKASSGCYKFLYDLDDRLKQVNDMWRR